MAREHGTYACYVWGPQDGPGDGCRCAPCRAANAAQTKRNATRIAPAYVGGDTSRQHLRFLVERGVGLKTVAKRTGIAYSSLCKIQAGQTRRVKPDTQAKILAVSPADAADGAYIPAGPTWEIVGQLLERGWTKVRIAEAIGQQRALQLSRHKVTAGNARAIAALLEQPVPPRRSRFGVHELPQPVEPDPEPVELPAILRIDTISAAPWRKRSACALPNVPTWLFFPGRGDVETTQRALAVCKTCPVAAECLEAHLDEKEGIWGGTTARQRRRLRRERGIEEPQVDDDQADESEAA